MKFFTQLLERLNVNNHNKRQQIPTIPPHMAALGFRRVIVDCLLGMRLRRDYYHPEIIAASSDLKGYLEKAYMDLETSPIRDFWGPVRNVWVDVWYGYRGTLEAGLMSYGRQDLIGVVIDALPDESPHGATGYCVALSSHLLRAVLPLPESFHCGLRTLCDKQKIKDWFIANRANLKWNPSLERYIFVSQEDSGES